MGKGPLLPLTVGGIGLAILLVNLVDEGRDGVAFLAMGMILFSITLAIVGHGDGSG